MRIHRCDGEQTRKKLLVAAGRVFAEKGYRDATTAEICRRAGANIAAIHYHFRSKAHLYVEACRYVFEQSIAAYPPDGGVPADAPVEQRLRGQILSLVRRVKDPDSIGFDIVQKEMANPTGLLSGVMRRFIDPLQQQFIDIVRELLGPEATAQEVQLCAMSVHVQCLKPTIRERHRKRAFGGGRPSRLMPAVEVDTLVDHILRFSLAGIRGMQAE